MSSGKATGALSEQQDVLSCPAPTFADGSLARLLASEWGIDGASTAALPSERDLNVVVDRRFVLKVSNPAEPPEVINMENKALAHAHRTTPDLPLPLTISTKAGSDSATAIDQAGRRCVARLITVLPGSPAEGQSISADLAASIGALCARTSIALQGFFHPAAARIIDWDVRRAASVLEDVSPDVLHLSVDAFADLRGRCDAAAQASSGLPSGINHADVTLTNVLVSDGQVSGLIDLGDMHHTPNVCDLAVTLTSIIRNTASQQDTSTWELARAVITGYQRHRLLLPEEVDVLGDLVLARLALTLAISDRRVAQHQDNTPYISQYDTATARVLRELSDPSGSDLAQRLHRMAGTAHALRRGRGSETTDGGGDDLVQRRQRAMGGSLSPLFYSQPLEFVRGDGPWLIDASGHRHLDAYNNVPVLGHAHPAVVQAVSRQLAALNTHSRYLHHNIVELAERILSTMPDELDTCLFTTSGTEANDLAWRMATAHTECNGAIIAEHAYHGSSKWFADLSSNEWPPGHRPPHVATFAAPRAETGGMDQATAASRIASAADELRCSGDRLALVLADIGFTSEGILDAPTDFLEGLIEGAHAQSALFLADEVQSGFGRIGPPLWRFAAHGLVPDFVTLGKPMGAGYPIGALITRREIADSLARDYEYFSTFAATPAAAAASLAVLDTLEYSDIPAQAVAVGSYLRDRLRELANSQPQLGAIRGSGLIAGMDTMGAACEPDPSFSRALLDELTKRRVLAGLTGPDSTVLKIRPPLVWERRHADMFVAALDDSLTYVGGDRGRLG